MMHYMRNVKLEALTCSIFGDETLPDDPSLWLDYEATEAALQINQGTYSGKNAIKGKIYTTSFKSGPKIKGFSLPCGKL